VLDVTRDGLKLIERAPGVTIDEIVKFTEAELAIEEVAEMPV
jgi:3-oxoacid CoA-transferase subunit B